MAISLQKIQETAPALVSLYKTAGISLRKNGLQGSAPRSTWCSTTRAR